MYTHHRFEPETSVAVGLTVFLLVLRETLRQKIEKL